MEALVVTPPDPHPQGKHEKKHLAAGLKDVRGGARSGDDCGGGAAGWDVRNRFPKKLAINRVLVASVPDPEHIPTPPDLALPTGQHCAPCNVARIRGRASLAQLSWTGPFEMALSSELVQLSERFGLKSYRVAQGLVLVRGMPDPEDSECAPTVWNRWAPPGRECSCSPQSD